MSVLCSEIQDIEDLLSGNIAENNKDIFQNNGIYFKKRKKDDILTVAHTSSSITPGTQVIYIKTWGCTHNKSDTEYMAGQLASYGYKLTEDKYIADLWLLNSCTVKNPAEDHFKNEINLARKLKKYIVVAGCIPQAAPKSSFIYGLSIIGVQQIDRVVEVVEETLKGNTVKFLNKKKEIGRKLGGASLALPKIRRNPLIEIIAVNTGCLNQCTYCKTKYARGDLGSYTPEEIIERAKQAFNEGVCELWLTSEDIGTYGKDIGTNLPDLVWKLIEVIPDGCRMRIGMTNPPYILEYLEEMSKILQHPKIYRFLHLPVQSGSDKILNDMKRKYTRGDFEYIINFLKVHVPNITIATDVICGFPTETNQDFEDTISLCRKYKFPSLFINQFFARPGTPAALMTQIPNTEIKRRTKILSDLFHSYEPFNDKLGEIQDVLVTEIAHDEKHYVGHNCYYEQVLVPMQREYMGKIIKVKIVSTSKYSMKGQPLNKGISPALTPDMKQRLILELSTQVKPNKIHVLAIITILFAIFIRFFWKFLTI